jgi:hypothetical protein
MSISTQNPHLNNKLKSSPKLTKTIILTLIILANLSNSHIIETPKFNWKSKKEEKPFHECVHSKKIKEIVGDTIMIHQPTEEELNQKLINSQMAEEGMESSDKVNWFFLLLMSFSRLKIIWIYLKKESFIYSNNSNINIKRPHEIYNPIPLQIGTTSKSRWI